MAHTLGMKIPAMYRVRIPDSTDLLTFVLRAIPESSDVFYECTRCIGCGCPSFSTEKEEVPSEIVDHLNWHAGFCSGIVYPTPADR
jgi:hypothetical protein